MRRLVLPGMEVRRLPLWLVIAGMVVAIPTAVPAQFSPRPLALPKDSVKTLNEAIGAVRRRQEQMGQEQYLRTICHPGMAGGCFQVGRPMSAATVQQRRTAMMATLSEASAADPGDEWITGALIDQHLQAGEVVQAVAVARNCRGAPWWCELLRVYVAFRTDPLMPTDSLLSDALARMPPPVRCAWGDVSLLLQDGDARARYERMSCAERAAFEERFWWLTDPMFSIPGNERRTEHFAREVQLRLDYEWTIASTNGYAAALQEVGDFVGFFDIAEPDLVKAMPTAMTDVSYGAASGSRRMPTFNDVAVALWNYLHRAHTHSYIVMARPKEPLQDELSAPRSQGPSAVMAPDDAIRLGQGPMSIGPARTAATIVQFMDGERHHASFVPKAEAVDAPFQAQVSDWTLVPKDLEDVFEVGVSRMGPLTQLDWQMGYFLRGDSARIVAVTDLHDESTTGLRAALAISKSPRAPPLIFRAAVGPRFVFSPIVPADSLVVSLEVLSLSRAAGRVRSGGAPPAPTGERLRVSDVMLYQPEADDHQPSLDELLPRLYPSSRVAQGSSVGLFWEEYGLAAGEAPTLTITAVRNDTASLLTRARSRFFGSRASGLPVTVVTEEQASGNTIQPRTLSENLSALEPGYYTIVLTVSVPGQVPVEVERNIEVLGLK